MYYTQPADMLPAQGDKSMIHRYEKIVAGDVRLMVEWRTVRLDVHSQPVPKQLRFVRDGTPGLHRSLMHTSLGHLSLGARENRLTLLPGVALPVPVIPCGPTG